jgi:hypothetical protein
VEKYPLPFSQWIWYAKRLSGDAFFFTAWGAWIFGGQVAGICPDTDARQIDTRNLDEQVYASTISTNLNNHISYL